MASVDQIPWISAQLPPLSKVHDGRRGLKVEVALDQPTNQEKRGSSSESSQLEMEVQGQPGPRGEGLKGGQKRGPGQGPRRL